MYKWKSAFNRVTFVNYLSQISGYLAVAPTSVLDASPCTFTLRRSKPHEPTSATFKVFSSPLSATKLQTVRAFFWLGVFRECCTWFDLTFRPLKLSIWAMSLFYFLITHVFSGVAILTSRTFPFHLKINCLLLKAPLVAQMVKNLPAMWETQVWSLCWEDLLEKGMATHSILPWRIPWAEEPGGLPSIGLQRVGHDWTISFFSFGGEGLTFDLSRLSMYLPR